jgi:transposase-like protein
MHKMRNILEKVQKRDCQPVKADARGIYQAENRRQAQQAFRQFQKHWLADHPGVVRQLERDLPELLNFFAFPRYLIEETDHHKCD